jgi:hypothetical protein
MQTLARTANRLADYFEQPLPEIPGDPCERQDQLAETVLQAVQTLRGLLRNTDKAIVLRAAEAILTLENTRIRHGSNVTGCRERLRPDWECRKELDECVTSSAPPTEQEKEDEAFAKHAAEVRKELVALESEKPTGERKPVAAKTGRTFVRACLTDWNRTATSIPAGTFWREFLKRDVESDRPRNPKAEDSADRGTIPWPFSKD